jgi:hypothetical protein
MTVDGWSVLTVPGTESYHALWAPVMLVELSLNLCLIAGSLLLLLLALRRRSSMPRLYIGLIGVGIAVNLTDFAAAQLIRTLADQWTPRESAELFRSALLGGIWTAYFLRSKRVQRTFTGRLQPAPAKLLVEEAAVAT